MSNKYVTDIVGLIRRPLEDLESGRVDLVEICIDVSRKEISGHIATKVRERPREENEEEEDEH